MIKTSLHANVFKAPWDSGPLGLFFVARAQTSMYHICNVPNDLAWNLAQVLRNVFQQTISCGFDPRCRHLKDPVRRCIWRFAGLFYLVCWNGFWNAETAFCSFDICACVILRSYMMRFRFFPNISLKLLAISLPSPNLTIAQKLK